MQQAYAPSGGHLLEDQGVHLHLEWREGSIPARLKLCAHKIMHPILSLKSGVTSMLHIWYTRAMHVLIYVFVLSKFLSQIFARCFDVSFLSQVFLSENHFS